jgi:serine phosphatase RsbU (regulator of sigma subunit)
MRFRFISKLLFSLTFFFVFERPGLANTPADSALINKLIRQYKVNYKKPWALTTLDSISKLSRKANYGEGLCYYYYRKTLQTIQRTSLDTASVYIDSMSRLAAKINSSFYKALALRETGRLYQKKEDSEKAISYFLQALKIFDPNKITHESVSTYMFLGVEYYSIAEMKNNKEYAKKAMEYFELCEQLATKAHLEDILSRCYNNFGALNFHILKDYKKALECFEKSLAVKEKLNMTADFAASYSNIGNSLCMMAREAGNNKSLYNKAIENYNKAEKLNIEKGDSANLLNTYINLGSAHMSIYDLPPAFEYLKKLEFMCTRIPSITMRLAVLNYGSDYYLLKKDHARSLDYFKRMISLKDSVQSQESVENINKLQVEYGTFKKDKEIELLTKNKQINALELAKRESDINKQRMLIISALLVLVVLIVFLFYIYRANKEKQRINLKLEEQHKDITDSINYAKLIQQAIFPEKELKYRLFPDAFVLLMPKDVVSGDFYWFGEQNGKRIIAAVDCTGHGVPGAFMSMIGNAFLNEIIHEKKITTPSVILNELRAHVIHALKQEGRSMENKDGMDIAICVFDKDFKSVEFAGANNPLWLIRGDEVQQLNADKQPIGLSGKELKDFTNHKIDLEKNDLLYIFTDGYADQFGGAKGKKFKYKPLQELLKANKHKPMLEVETILVDTFNSWKGNLHQVDDVCIVGIRV